LRLLKGRNELAEPFGEGQVGSSAMAYKRNPMRAERLCALARYAMSLEANGPATLATQWLERTLDDSANRRLTIPQAFLATDAMLRLCVNIIGGMVAYPEVIGRHIAEELPFMATENILMAAVAAGGDRQDLHERIRRHSIAAAAQVKEHGRANDLIDRLKNDAALAAVDFDRVLNTAAFVGRAPEQVERFIESVVDPIRNRWPDLTRQWADVDV
jgi:adenylosuccinate lyase